MHFKKFVYESKLVHEPMNNTSTIDLIVNCEGGKGTIMDIPLSSDALDIAFHPGSTTSLLATGLISGKVQLIDFSALEKKREDTRQSRSASKSSDEEGEGEESENTDIDDDIEDEETLETSKGKSRMYDKRWSLRPSSKSCRGIQFDHDGSSLYSLAKEGSIYRIDTETGSIVSHWKKVHEAAPSRVICIEPNLLATGDDDGIVSLWDTRKASTSSIRSYTHHFDWITSLLWCPHLAPPKAPKLSKEEKEKRRLKEEKKNRRKDRKRSKIEEDDKEEDEKEMKTSRERLVCTSGDGTLSVIDIRMGAAGVDVSEDQEDELLSIASVKHDSKLVVGTQMGILSLWAPTRGLLDHVDRIPGHPASVDAMCALDKDTILTGSSDGFVRVVQILPHKLLGIVADHNGLPVERIARKDYWLASIGHGAEVKLTDLKPLLDEDDEDDDDGEVAERRESDDEGNKGATELVAEGSEEQISSEEDSDSDSASIPKPVPKKSKIEVALSKSDVIEGSNSFFADL